MQPASPFTAKKQWNPLAEPHCFSDIIPHVRGNVKKKRIFEARAEFFCGAAVQENIPALQIEKEKQKNALLKGSEVRFRFLFTPLPADARAAPEGRQTGSGKNDC